ncbi:TIGR02206 family membrane protein [Paenibacillus sp. 1001270B_150601_E10]|uniref:YwaF family protein n=1 Tax=Paenibacillus sp. 1001270B_150601_E10 TaxID=2787079 RepID=UPI00189E3067|nr:TIGR02206 family membrane protein [Paenibacillus sp. 1001270B_150601_E10]
MSWLDAYAPESFVHYGASHVTALAIAAILIIGLYLFRYYFRYGLPNTILRFSILIVLVICEVTLNIWYVSEDVYNVKDTLPLELCTLSLYLSIAMLLLRSQWLAHLVYFTGIAGALQALLTPALSYDFPHYRFIEFFAAHIAIILAALYMVWVEEYRPSWKAIGIAMLYLNVLLVVIGAINAMLGSNYMFISGKPETPSLLDVLGPYPWYLLSLEGIALVMFVILYLPFAFTKNPRRSRQRLHLP